jgi:peptidyl-prolyl cis-trans isomerase D
MAVIQKLRNSGLVVVVIIAALILFVIGDALSSSSSMGLGDGLQGVVAKINDNSIKTKDLEAKAQEKFNSFLERAQEGELDEIDEFKMAIEQAWSQAWSEILSKQTIDREIELSGVQITEEDINDMLVGPNPLEDLKADPSFQTDGQYDRKKVESILKRARKDKNQAKGLEKFKNEIRERQIKKRYFNYLAKCNHKPKSVLKYEYLTANASVSGKIASINYSTISDNSIKVTDADLEKYLNNHREQFKNKEELRDIQYLIWKIIPSSEDSAYVLKQAMGAVTSLKQEAKPDSTLVQNSIFFSRGNLPKKTPKEVSEVVWTMPVNSVAGPYYKDGVYSVYRKLAEKKDTTPSINVAHILVQVGEAPNKQRITDSVAALAKANELAAQIKGGADMTKLALEWSADKGSASNGGSYGWVDKKTYDNYVAPYRDFALRAVKGQVEVVKSQFGYHVMKALENPDFNQIKFEEQKFEIAAGPKTIKEVDQLSRKFRNMVVDGDPKSFQNAVDKMGLNVLVQKDIKTDIRSLPGIEDYTEIREILNWLFDSKTKRNNVSDRMAFNNLHVVMMVNSVKHLGYAEVEDVREKIEPLVRAELKAEKIREKFEKAMASAKTIEELAQKTGASLIPIDGIRMSAPFLPQMNNDPKIVGALFGTPLKKMSKPIDGYNGVAVAFIEKRDKIEVPNSVLTNNPMQISGDMVMYYFTEGNYAIKASEIQDYRYKFTQNPSTDEDIYTQLTQTGNIRFELK